MPRVGEGCEGCHLRNPECKVRGTARDLPQGVWGELSGNLHLPSLHPRLVTRTCGSQEMAWAFRVCMNVHNRLKVCVFLGMLPRHRFK